MKFHLMSICLLLVAVGMAHAQADKNGQNSSPTEIRKLRIEFLEFRIDVETAKISLLEHSLQQIQTERLTLTDQERNGPQQFSAFEAQFQGQALAPEQQAEFDKIKAQVVAAQAGHLDQERAALQKREDELSAELRIEKQRCDALKTKLGELTVTP